MKSSGPVIPRKEDKRYGSRILYKRQTIGRFACNECGNLLQGKAAGVISHCAKWSAGSKCFYRIREGRSLSAGTDNNGSVPMDKTPLPGYE